MAKARPMRSLEGMESDLGYKVDALNHSESSTTHLYADLRPVVHNVYERTLREFEELEKQKASRDAIIRDVSLPELGVPKIIAHEGDTVVITRTSPFGFYSFTADIHYDFGLDLALLLTRNEASEIMHTSQLNHHVSHDLGSLFSKLPKELREKTYGFAHPNGTWTSEDIDSPKYKFVENVGDLSGFYYPLSNLGILTANKEMRREALPLAFRSTMFRLDDMDDLFKLLIAIGRIGRDNIASVEFAWQSRTDLERQWSIKSDSTEHSISLPTLHVGKCMQLLSQCKNLKFLRIFFDSDLILDIPPDAYALEIGFHDLCLIRGIGTLEICDLTSEPLKQRIFVTKLREAMQSSYQGKELGVQQSNTVPLD